MTDNSQKIKPAKRLSPLGHAVRFALRCGINSIEALAEELECTTSAIYRAIKQLQVSDPTVTVTDSMVTNQHTSTLTAQSLTDRTVTTTDPTVTREPLSPPLKKERSPPAPPLKKKNTPPQSLHACNARDQFEIEGLNGATSTLVAIVAITLATELGHPNFRDAREFLANQVGVFGPEKVRAGIVQWSAKVAEKSAPNTQRALVGFIQHARTQGAEVVEFEPEWKRKKREQYNEIRAIIEA